LRNLLNNISQKFNLTRTEVNTIIFVLVIFVFGLVINLSKIEIKEVNQQKFDYSFHDSLFKALEIEKRNELIEQEKNEKKVDSELELSDFSNTELDSKKEIVINPITINLNDADLETLIKLPGIGPKTAEKIIILRTQKGGFSRVDELTEVKGIGLKKLNKIKSFLFIE
jgi:competence protein ComEA